MGKNKSLDELYEYRGKLEELLIFARALGKIKMGNEILTYDELKEELSNIKAEIASRVSASGPHIVK